MPIEDGSSICPQYMDWLEDTITVNVSPIVVAMLTDNSVCYAASKGAVTNMTRSIALDYASEGIHCNAICPGCEFSQIEISIC